MPLTLFARIVRAMPWVPWLPVTAFAGLIGWSARGFPPDFASRHLYLRAGLMVLGLGLAFVFDDPASEITGPTPSPLRERRAFRAIVGLSVWLFLAGGLFALAADDMNVVLVHDSEVASVLPLGRILLEGLTIAAFGLGIAAVVSKRWDDEPGKVASAGLLVMYAASWAVPERWKPWSSPMDSRWETSQPWWWAALVAAVLIALCASWDARVGLRFRRREDAATPMKVGRTTEESRVS